MLSHKKKFVREFFILEQKNKSTPEIQIDPEEMENDLAMFLERTLSTGCLGTDTNIT